MNFARAIGSSGPGEKSIGTRIVEMRVGFRADGDCARRRGGTFLSRLLSHGSDLFCAALRFLTHPRHGTFTRRQSLRDGAKKSFRQSGPPVRAEADCASALNRSAACRIAAGASTFPQSPFRFSRCFHVSAGTIIKRFDEIGFENIALVGGKNASLGEMRRELRTHGRIATFRTPSRRAPKRS
jgi:hypothetical protein